MSVCFSNIYRKKKVLVTGNTGFKGSWLSIWLTELGAEVYGISDCIPTEPSHFEATNLKNRTHHFEKDIRDLHQIENVISEIKPDFLFHLAAQPIVSLSYENPVDTLTTNIIGTAHILEALRKLDSPCNAIIITSDKCYDNVEWEWGYRETDTLGGKDPYSGSKGGAELVIKTYSHSFFNSPESPTKIAVGRAGNVIGGGDWGINRLVPDCVKAWSQNETVRIRNPSSTRPWQHVLEPLSGYLRLGEKLATDPSLSGEPFNFGPKSKHNYTVSNLIDEMRLYWPDAQVEAEMEAKKIHEAKLLRLVCDKAKHLLEWEPVLSFNETAQFTVEWYREFYTSSHSTILEKTKQQIAEYVGLAKERHQKWVQ